MPMAFPMSEAITLNGTTAVAGAKAFKTITSIAALGCCHRFLRLAQADVFGLPIRANSRNYVLTAWNGAFVTTGTFTAAVATSPLRQPLATFAVLLLPLMLPTVLSA
jgi:hypothetical protein